MTNIDLIKRLGFENILGTASYRLRLAGDILITERDMAALSLEEFKELLRLKVIRLSDALIEECDRAIFRIFDEGQITK